MTIHSMGLSNTMKSLEIMNIMLQDTLRCVETQKKSAISGQVSAIRTTNETELCTVKMYLLLKYFI